MKKLIIISAIAISGLIYSNADAQMRRSDNGHAAATNHYNGGYAKNEQSGYNKRSEYNDRSSDNRDMSYRDRGYKSRDSRYERANYYERNQKHDNHQMRRF